MLDIFNLKRPLAVNVPNPDDEYSVTGKRKERTLAVLLEGKEKAKTSSGKLVDLVDEEGNVLDSIKFF